MNEELLKELGINPQRLQSKINRAQKNGLTKGQRRKRRAMVDEALENATVYGAEMAFQRGTIVPKMSELIDREHEALLSLIKSLSKLGEAGIYYDDVPEKLATYKDMDDKLVKQNKKILEKTNKK
ncbi:MAG: hypothetical protein U0M66_03265 [Bacilli bacterium]|nr:hypothetical protein [Bacilli bacterium]